MLATDIWRVGVVGAEAGAILARGSLEGLPIRWLPERRPFSYDADPFGLWRGGLLHLFVEAYDYRTRHGAIDVLRLDTALNIIDRRPCLAEGWHLSYPQVFEGEGETWLMPEAYRSGALTFYRATEFPVGWERAFTIRLDAPPVDATPFRHGGLWWLAYAPGTRKAMRQGALHLAFAERLAGPWQPHPLNPILVDPRGARPGGTVVRANDALILPVQDCSRTYGGALRPLHITTLTPDSVAFHRGEALHAPRSAAPYCSGLHSLSACGDVTLIDAKRIDHGLGGRAIDAGRIARALWPRRRAIGQGCAA